MAKRAEPEIHAYLDDLCAKGFYGELTFYFQDGDINNFRETARAGKHELLEKYRGQAERDGRKKRVAVTASPPWPR